MAVRILCRLRILARRYRDFRLVRIRARSCRCRDVHDLTSQDVFLGHDIARLEDLFSSGRQGLDRPLVAGQLICHCDVGDRQVTVVSHRDLIGDLLAQRIALAVCRRRSRLLRDGQMAFRVFRRLRILTRRHRDFRLVRIRARACRRRDVHDFVCQDVSLGHGVARLEGLVSSGRQGRDRPLVAGQLIRHRDVGDRQVTIIGNRDLIGDLISQSITVCRRLTRCDLRDSQVAVRSSRRHNF